MAEEPWLAAAGLRGAVLRQEAVEVIGEEVPVALAERRRPAEESAVRAQRLHEVAHGEALLDIVLRIQLTSRIECVRAANGGGPYERLMRMLDFVSGMTDSYAVALYRRVRGIALPGT